MKMSLARTLVAYDEKLKKARSARDWFGNERALQVEVSMGRNVWDDVQRTLDMDRDTLNHTIQQFLCDRIDMKIKEIEAAIAELEKQ